MIKILIADDHDVMRRGIRQLLETQPGWEVCGEASNGREAVDLVANLKPHVAIVDIGMPEMNGLEAARAMKKVSPRTEVLIFTMHDTEQLVHEVLSAGARGYVLKSDASRHLINAVEALAEHKPFFTSDVAATILDGYLNVAGGEAQSASVLTPREREIIQLLAEGKTNKEVANSLGISVKTAETHRAAIMRKLELKSTADLVRYAVRNNIIQP